MTYHAPSTYQPLRSEDYYAANDEYAGDFGAYVPSVSLSVEESVHYPWWSMDYYYLGSHLYRPSYWFGPRRTVGIGPHYWPYYGYYSPFYYPYSTYAWYDPWYGWPRFGIGTNLAYHEIYWVARVNYRAPERSTDRRAYGNSRYGNYGDPFNDPRDRAPYSSVNPGSLTMTPGTRTGTTEVRRRSNSKIRESRTGTTTPGSISGTMTRAPARPVVNTPKSISRPSPVSRPSSTPSARTPQPIKKHKQ